ncbi:kinase-like domain-containing protein [Ilyonectria robusta]|uniref:kinase-like domain-containing protein n=1 Tax=Ilyonectria robusta TaxID=1079257 RepID=UPI001E8CF4E2|nr:kinase-like domain-containing protein [Ilyonectria robusta]KAH8680292.1 kinase-like domain-containing protein [Ilyonectria robusta]
MATRPGALQHRVSDLVVDSEIDATWNPSTNQTTQIRRTAGTKPSRRREKTEEIWERKHELGGGAYGTVWLEECFTVSSQQEPRLRAVKEIRKHHSVPTSAFHRELEAIAKFSHDKFADCFVRSFGWFQNETALFITMEYLEHGDLRHYIVRPFPEPEARLIAMQLVEALQSMHKSGFAHRDLKPGNILVVHRGPRWWVKICDFGISKRVEGSTALRTMEVGTMGYMAPEVLGMFTLEDLQENQTEVAAYTSAVDLWALGEITHKLLTQKATFLSPNQRANYVTMGTQFPTNELESVGASTHCILFIQQTMAASPRKRLTADEAAGHEWLENYEDIDEAQGRSSPER